MGRCVLTLVVVALAGCSTLPTNKGLDPASTPDTKVGYIAGTFAVSGSDQFAFQLVPRGTKRVGDSFQGDSYLLAFADVPDQKNIAHESKTQVIAVPPGEYRIAGWVVFLREKSGWMGAWTYRKDFAEDDPMSTRFVVEPGHVVFLGTFYADTDHKYWGPVVQSEWTVKPQETRADEVPARLEFAYPGFAGVPTECFACVAPAPARASSQEGAGETVPIRLEATVPRDAAPDPASGYVAGTFWKLEGSSFAFVLVDELGKERVLTFGESKAGEVVNDLTGMAAVPPGRYRIRAWASFASGSDVGRTKSVEVPHPLARPFDVKAGHVVYIGKFSGTYAESTIDSALPSGLVHYRQKSWSLDPLPSGADEVVEIVRTSHRGFRAQPIECLLCIAPLRPGAEAAAPAFDLPKPGKKAVVHYHRPDGDYAGVGLWTWDGAQRGDGVHGVPGDLPGTPPEHLPPPTGVDGFGAFWSIDQGSFRSGGVSFVIRRAGESIEGPARSWLLFDSSDVWVNADDGFLHYTPESAARWHSRETP